MALLSLGRAAPSNTISIVPGPEDDAADLLRFAIIGNTQAGETLVESAEADPGLDPRKIGAEAEMDAEAKSQMARKFRPIAVDDELVWAVIFLRIVVSRGVEAVETIARYHSDFADHATEIALHRTVKAQSFLHCGLRQSVDVGQERLSSDRRQRQFPRR
jgi:hypothetical protein